MVEIKPDGRYQRQVPECLPVLGKKTEVPDIGIVPQGLFLYR